MVQIARKLENGHLTIKHDGKPVGVYSSIIATTDKLKEVITGIKQSAYKVGITSEQITAGNKNLNHRSQEQASSLKQIANNMDDMTTIVQQNAEYTRQAEKLAKAARENACQGGLVVQEVISSMDEINKTSKQIAEIIGVINEISFQTNLLSLNAAVEAARAGEQGRGFAVVANEVSNLAKSSTSAAKNIKELIEGSVRKVEEGTVLASDSGKVLNEIMESVDKVSEVIADITNASQEQSDGIAQINTELSQMDTMTQENATLVEQATTSAREMGIQAEELNTLVAYFKLDDDESSLTKDVVIMNSESNEKVSYIPY